MTISISATATSLLKLAYDWQTLESGLIAIAAAVIGALVVLQQTRAQEESEERRLHRIALASRAALPIVLDEVIAWTIATSRTVLALERWRHTPDGSLNPAPPPAVSDVPGTDQIVRELKEAVAALPETASQRCGAILRALQVTRSRVIGHVEGVSGSLLLTVENTYDMALDLADVRSLAESLFAYARFRTDQLSPQRPTWTEFAPSLDMLWLDKLKIPEAKARFQRLKPK